MTNIPKKPEMPEGMIESIKLALKNEKAPFLNYLESQVKLKWTNKEESRLGYTKFEIEHNEIFRRKRLKVSPGVIIIALNPILHQDLILYKHTLAHELLHAAGLIEHNENHKKLVDIIAPAPKLNDSAVLRELRQQILDTLPERQWICGDCGHTWERRRVSTPLRCPKCARAFKTK